jgi:hypothetical protein
MLDSQVQHFCDRVLVYLAAQYVDPLELGQLESVGRCQQILDDQGLDLVCSFISGNESMYVDKV